MRKPPAEVGDAPSPPVAAATPVMPGLFDEPTRAGR